MALRFLTPQAQKMWLQKEEKEKNEEMVWCKKVKLLVYYKSLAILVNEDWCAQFMSSAIQRSKWGSPRNIIGTVNGIEIPFHRKYLMEQMGWNFMEGIDWNLDNNLENTNPLSLSPDLNAFFQVAANSKDKYDLNEVSNLNPVWGVRIRGLLSGLWLSHKFKFVSKKKLELIMRADGGEAVYWPAVVETAFRKEFFDLMEFPDEACDSPIRPFLTSYIHAYLAREEKERLTMEIKAMHLKEDAITTTRGKQRSDDGVGDIRKDNEKVPVDEGSNKVPELVILEETECDFVQKKDNCNSELDGWMVEEELRKAFTNAEHEQVLIEKDKEIANLHRQLADLRVQIDEMCMQIDEKDEEIADLCRQLAMSSNREGGQVVAHNTHLAEPLNSEAMDIPDSMTLKQAFDLMQKCNP